jgi:hypothetical protein
MPLDLLPSIWRTIRERRSLLMSVVVLGWSTKYLVTLALTHTAGPELYGVLSAALSTGAAIANIALLRAPRTSLIATIVILGLWVLIAIAGIGGTIAHAIGPVPGHGPIDLRPRPIVAPLAFTLLGLVGGAALYLGQRMRMRHAPKLDKE